MTYHRLWAWLALSLVQAAQYAQAADALNGKSLYLNGPTSGGTNCAACHSASPTNNVSNILAAANNPSVISSAFAANKGGMGSLYNGKFSAAEIADLAAFIGNPSVTAAPAASVAPATLSFGGATVGQDSGALATTLSNTGSAALNLSSIALGGSNGGDFRVTGGSCASGISLAAGANCTVQLVFRPSASGGRSGSLTINHNATGGSSNVALSGTGNAVAQATLSLSATALDFGALLVNAPSQRTLTLTNSGQAAMTFASIGVSGAQAGYLTLGGTCATGTPLAVGANCTVILQALPVSAGAFAASLNLASNASNANVTVGISGSAATPAPAIGATPSAVAFGLWTIGAAPLAQQVTLNNNGNVALAFSSIAVGGAPAISIASGGTCGSSLAVGASCTVPLAFAPAATGDVAGTLLVRSNAADLSVAVTGSGTTSPVARPALSNSGPIGFADTQVGQQSSVQRNTLSNSGTGPLKIASLVLGGSHTGDFALAGTCTTDATLSPGASCVIDATFKPTAAGLRIADMLLVTDGGAQFSVRLNGNASAVPAPAPTLGLAPQAFDYGSTAAGGAGLVKRFALSNTGSAALVLNSVSFSGPFAVASGEANACGAFPLTLQAGASCELPVRFAPTAAGSASGTATLQASGASWQIALNGQGSNNATPAGSTQNHGGGGCSSIGGGNDPMLAVLAALAAGVLLWRRRQARVLAAAAALAVAGQAMALEPGQAAPGFVLNGPGGTVKLEHYQGKLVYIDFWASWCGPCRQSFPWMNEMQARYGGQGLQVVGINVDAKTDDARSFLNATPASFVIAFDPNGTAPRNYGVKGMPSSVLIGPDGKVLYEHSGFRPADRTVLEARIKTALGVRQ
ncbi:Thiol-disulfide isomerase or thioredoxin [Duganella sp. CF458]|uniref:choice-of-anchor D domain-containing protein n=1 Tax=Duganella sp. CF458 TaxID=1884368 RepID=UPI0008E97308|nr:choice-of-anchor D domain-containing protein [Duganella sp. CF458]SFF78002.1 Thiol-disulfide isomerase or thioredoxin [Duganella sp. CF458]